MNYIRANFKKIYGRLYYQVTFLITFLICLVFPIALKIFAAKENVRDILYGIPTGFFSQFGFLMPLFLIGTLLYEEIEQDTLKNQFTSGYGRKEIFLYNLITMIIVTLSHILIGLAGFFISSIILFGIPEGYLLEALFFSLVGSFPIWLGNIGLVIFLGYFINNSSVMGVTWSFINYMIPPVLKILGGMFNSKFILNVRSIFPTELMMQVIKDSEKRIFLTKDVFLRNLIFGTFYIIIFSYFAFRKHREKDF